MPLPLLAAAAPAVGGIVGGFLQGKGQQSGIRAAGQQIQQGMGENRNLSNQFRQEQSGMQQPWIQGGQQGFTDLQNFRMREANPYQAQQFGGVNMQEDPGVQYRMQQGQQAMDASAANRGNLFSGAQQKALMKYGQDMGSQEFNNAYGRQYGQFQDAETARRNQANTEADRTMNYDQYRMNQLQGISGQGQAATGQLASAYGNIGNNQLNNQMQLRGAYANNQAANASMPWQMAGNAVAGLGNLGKDMGSYFMNKG